MRWLNKWLVPVRQIAVCKCDLNSLAQWKVLCASYCGRGLLPHQVLPCCLAYREWHAAGNEGTPPDLVKQSCRVRKQQREKARYEKRKAEKERKRFVYPKEELEKLTAPVEE